jgi:hypothetical protein
MRRRFWNTEKKEENLTAVRERVEARARPASLCSRSQVTSATTSSLAHIQVGQRSKACKCVSVYR